MRADEFTSLPKQAQAALIYEILKDARRKGNREEFAKFALMYQKVSGQRITWNDMDGMFYEPPEPMKKPKWSYDD